MQHLPLRDRADLDDAYALIEAYGPRAEAEATARADASRRADNLVNFCRWRLIGRAVRMLHCGPSGGLLH